MNDKSKNFESEFLNEKKVQGFRDYDHNENSVSITYLLSDDEDNDNEYIIEGDCKCCYECVSDDNCEMGEYCVEKIGCVECKSSDDCMNELICNQGKCVNGVCENNNECENDDEWCNLDGKCVKGCRNDNNCNNGEICDYWDRNCKESCRNNGDCSEKGLVCINNKCKNGCFDNFDCNSYDNVCVNNQCVNTNEAINCVDNEDCSTGYYCEYEYLICVLDNSINRREKEIVPAAVCSLYGVVSIFFMASSYYMATKTSKQALQDMCYQRCTEVQQPVTEVNVDNVVVTDFGKRKGMQKQDSECRGSCKPFGSLKYHEAVVFSKNYCHYQSLTEIVTAEAKNTGQVISIFQKMLAEYCDAFTYGYMYKRPKGKKGYWTNSRVCSTDYKTISCKPISKI